MLHPLLIVAVFVVVFLAIHPFQDGNGRLSRVLTTLLLLRAGYSRRCGSASACRLLNLPTLRGPTATR